MNILYLLSQRPDSTGSGIYTRTLMAEASGAGHRCSLIAACSAMEPPDLREIQGESAGMICFDEPPLSFPIPGMSDVMPYNSSRFADLDSKQLDKYRQAFMEAIVRAVEADRPDVIHSNHLWIMSALARRLFPEIPMVVSCHGTDLRQFRLCPHLGESIIDDIRAVDMILALSDTQKEEIEALFGVDEKRVMVVPNGFDPAVFFPAPKPPVPPHILLYAGKISISKGVPLLIGCLSHERLRHLPLHLYIAGSGSGYEKDLCTSLAEKIPDKVTFCGSLRPCDLADLMRKSHVFVLPSFYEGLPLVIIEALASGCRLVATDLPGICGLVNGLSGDWGRLVRLPELQTVDSPFEKDLPLIADRLAMTLESQILGIDPCRDPSQVFFNYLKEKYSWKHVFRRVEGVYAGLVSL